MDQEVSVVARKLETYFEPEESKALESRPASLLRHGICIVLLGLAVILTRTSLFLTRLIKKIES
jgi:hypothetical protein